VCVWMHACVGATVGMKSAGVIEIRDSWYFVLLDSRIIGGFQKEVRGDHNMRDQILLFVSLRYYISLRSNVGAEIFG